MRRIRPILQPELVSPDRSYDTGLAGYDTPESIEWSPDDRLVAISRPEGFTFDDGERLAATGIWACSISNGKTSPLAVHARRYTRAFYFYLAPRWSPDGRYLVCVGEGIQGQSAIRLRPLADVGPAGSVPRYDKYEDVGWPAWSPDGRLLAFRQRILRDMTARPVECLRVVSPGGHEARNVVELYSTQAEPAPRITGIAWSPDGRSLAFAATPDGVTTRESAVYVVDAPGAHAPRRAAGPEDSPGQGYFAPVWIGADKLGALRTRPAGGYDAVVIRVNTGRARAIRTLCRVPTDDMDWSPDRTRIVCAPQEGSTPRSQTTLRILSTRIQ